MNHRPTLEGKRGYEKAIKDTIQHARLLKGHTQLKFRLDVVELGVKERFVVDALQSEQKRLKTDESAGLGLDYSSESDSDAENLLAGEASEAALGNGVSGTIDPSVGIQSKDSLRDTEKKDGDSADAGADSETRSGSEGGSESSSESESESEDEESDSEAIRAELEKLREEELLSQQKADQISNSLPKKSSWRSSRPFTNRSSTSQQLYTTDSLKSSTHKQFLSKYIR